MAARASSRTEPDGAGWWVRDASLDDLDGVVAAVGSLMLELGGVPPGPDAMRATARTLIEDERAGSLFVAENGERLIVGVLAVSWQTAIHAGGSYGLIQDLWVHPGWRRRAVGAGLLAAFRRAAMARRVARVEVGLPRERFSGAAATATFYRSNGFEPIGPRMRVEIS